jgi:ABC-type transport system involved in multi-copper enzyme maturation permease subunit
MLLLLIRKELLDQVRSLRFAMACIICPAVILSSVFVLTRDYKDAAQDFRTNTLMHRDQLEEYGFPHELTNNGIMIDKPLNPMKVFFRGVDAEHTQSVRISAVSEPEFQANYDKNPVSLLFPIMDLTFVAGIIMSLLAITFSYDTVSGEKELGTLKLLISYSVPRDMVLLSKWIGGYIALIAPFLASILLGLTVVLLFPEIHLQGADWLSLLLSLLGVLVYLSTIYSLGLFVSCRTNLASTSITVLLLIWVAMVLVMPNIAPHVARMVNPTPSMQSVETEKAELQDEAQRKMREEWQPWIQEARQNGTPVEEMVAKYKGLESTMGTTIAEGRAKINEHFRHAMEAQVDLARQVAMISPAAIFVITVCDLSGTGVQEQNYFRDLLKRYAGQWSDYAYSKFDAAIYQGEAKLEIGEYPQFKYEPMTFRDRISETAISIAIMAIWNLVFLMGAYLSFLRYDVK